MTIDAVGGGWQGRKGSGHGIEQPGPTRLQHFPIPCAANRRLPISCRKSTGARPVHRGPVQAPDIRGRIRIKSGKSERCGRCNFGNGGRWQLIQGALLCRFSVSSRTRSSAACSDANRARHSASSRRIGKRHQSSGFRPGRAQGGGDHVDARLAVWYGRPGLYRWILPRSAPDSRRDGSGTVPVQNSPLRGFCFRYPEPCDFGGGDVLPQEQPCSLAGEGNACGASIRDVRHAFQRILDQAQGLLDFIPCGEPTQTKANGTFRILDGQTHRPQNMGRLRNPGGAGGTG